jgi:hypothetical protein
MIKLDFTLPETNDWDNWINSCQDATNESIQSYQSGTPIEITNLYRGEIARYHRHPFYGKCAYCESKVETTSPDYVEHFRPKAGVRDINNNIVVITINEIQVPHPGYYWLCYKWENLLPTCWKCNTWHKDASENMVGKGNRFPVSGGYAVNPGDEENEASELINPMFENPSTHIFMDEVGLLHPVPGSSKGSICIDFFGLNVRDPLVHGRRREYTNIVNKIKFLYVNSTQEQREKEIAELNSIINGRDEYTIAAKKAVSDVLSVAQNIKDSIQQ